MYHPSLTVKIFCFLASVLFFSCAPEQEEIVQEIFQAKTSHEAYEYKLDQLGVLSTALGKDWTEAAQKAMTEPMLVEAPFSEEFYIDPLRASGTGYRFTAMRGHRVEINLTAERIDSSELFLDVFRVDSDSLQQYSHIASLNDSLMQVIFEPQNDANYIIRFQCEILRGGRFSLKIIHLPSLVFPVTGKTKSAIGSLFGAPRDAGRRVHHGIDIFSRRHTPIIAPCDGYIGSTKDNELGGKVIWLKDRARGQTLYFAHLEDVLVEEDTFVEVGDTIGTVGNSGNARTTAPHLHFGMYNSGPIDPYHFVVETKTRFKRNLADTTYIGQTVRANKNTNLRIRNVLRRGQKIGIDDHQILHVLGTSAAYYHVQLPDSTEGYIFYGDIETLERPIARRTLTKRVNIYNDPSDTNILKDIAKSNSVLKVFGTNNNLLYTIDDNGSTGWIKNDI